MRRLLVLLFLFLPQVVAACSCVWPGRPCRALAETTAVLSGRVLSIREIRVPEGDTQNRVTLRILQAFKGVRGAALEVVTGHGGGVEA
jgi:hypothetical protein